MDYTPRLRWYALTETMRMYHADLAYRMQPLLPLPSTMMYINHTPLAGDSLSCGVPPYQNPSPPSYDDRRAASENASNMDTADPDTPSRATSLSLDLPLTYADVYTSFFSISRELNGHIGCINSLALNHSGELLLSGSDDLSFCLYDTCDWTLRNRYRTMHHSNIFGAVFLPGNERCVLSCALDGRTLLTDLERAEPFYKCYMSMASSIAVSKWWPETAYVAYSNAVIARIDTRLRSSFNQPPDVGNPCISEVTQVRALAVHERWPFLIASGTNTSRVYFHDVRMGFLGAFSTLSISSVPWCDGVSGLAFSESGDWLAVNYRRQDIYVVPWLDALYSARPGEVSHEDHNECNDGFERLLGMGKAGKLPGATVHNPIRLRGRQNNQTMFKEVTFMENDNIVCSGGDCGNVFFWRLRGGDLLHTTQGDSDIVNAVLYNNRTGALLVSGIDDTIKVLESDGRLQKAGLSHDAGGDERVVWTAADGSNISLMAPIVADVSDAIVSETNLYSNFIISSDTEEDSDGGFSVDNMDSGDEAESRLRMNDVLGSLRTVCTTYRRCACGQFALVMKLNESTDIHVLRQITNKMRKLSDIANNVNVRIDSAVGRAALQPTEGLPERELSIGNNEEFGVIARDRGDSFLTDHVNYSSGGTHLSEDAAEEYMDNTDDSSDDITNDVFLLLEPNETVYEGELLLADYVRGTQEDLDTGGMNSDFSVSLFPMMCTAFYTAKRILDSAFRQWIIPGSGPAQIPRWNQCRWGTTSHISGLANDAWFNEHFDNGIAEDIALNRSVTRREVSGGADDYNQRLTGDQCVFSGHRRVISLLYIIDFLLQGKEYMCTTTKESRQYWMFRCVLELGYLYYYMAIGDAEMAIERVTRLERHAEYRCVTALGSVNKAYMQRQYMLQRKRQSKGQKEQSKASCNRPASILELSRSLDATCFPPLLVPLALHIRILVLSQKDKTVSPFPLSAAFPASIGLEEDEDEEAERNTQSEENDRTVQSEGRISMLVEEMKNRLDGHPNRRVKQRVISMLSELHINV